jgi:SAM-dependent methyltransferase
MRSHCSVCGGTSFKYQPILWQSLIDEWQLSTEEVEYTNRQQGQACTECGANLRSIALADALRAALHISDTLLAFCASSASSAVRVLELNEAGTLHATIRRLPGHVFGAYPEVDMHALPFEDGLFDLVVHSDTLEHVPNPLHALAECRRVLRPGGALCYTVPIVVGRLSRDRSGLPKSYHGNPAQTGDDYVVHTEFGADAWIYPMRAGFSEVRLYGTDHPAAHAIAAYTASASMARTP